MAEAGGTPLMTPLRYAGGAPGRVLDRTGAPNGRGAPSIVSLDWAQHKAAWAGAVLGAVRCSAGAVFVSQIHRFSVPGRRCQPACHLVPSASLPKFPLRASLAVPRSLSRPHTHPPLPTHPRSQTGHGLACHYRHRPARQPI